MVEIRREDLAVILSDQQKAAGLYLEEEQDHFILLKQANRVRAVFSQTGVTKDSIQVEADRWVGVYQDKGELEIYYSDLGGH